MKELQIIKNGEIKKLHLRIYSRKEIPRNER